MAQGVKYPDEVIAEALRLTASGVSNRKAAAQLGVSTGAVSSWRRGLIPSGDPRRRTRPPDEDWRPPDPAAYCYLLGWYLGDGWITGRYPYLTIISDDRYPEIVAECERAIERTVPGIRAFHYPARVSKAFRIQASWAGWPVAIPQHGPGRKHTRKIELVDWQLELTHRFPEWLLRGLVHSDGCRCINRFKTTLPSGRVAEYEYPRYFFTNMSEDILGIFASHCDLLGIRWTRSNHKSISISNKRDVALLDTFIGPKA